MTRPSGEQAFEGYSIRWSSEATTPTRANVNGPSGQGFYRVALYRIYVDVTRPDGSAWFARHWHQIGYRQVANMHNELLFERKEAKETTWQNP